MVDIGQENRQVFMLLLFIEGVTFQMTDILYQYIIKYTNLSHFTSVQYLFWMEFLNEASLFRHLN